MQPGVGEARALWGLARCRNPGLRVTLLVLVFAGESVLFFLSFFFFFFCRVDFEWS